MDADDQPIFGGALRRANDAAIEDSGILGAHRRWTNINRYEVAFLILGVLAALASDGLTIYRMATTADLKDPDFVYGILILVNSVFLLIFLVTGIFQQRITDIVAFFISALMLTVYVVVHYLLRKKQPDDKDSEATLRLVRLICTITFNILFIPFSIFVIRDYQRDEFAQRLFGAFPAARRPLKFYNIFDCVARIDTMFSISICFLNLYNFNQLEHYDEILLGVGTFFALLWLGFGVGMIRLESRLLFAFFCVIALYEPTFLGYCLYSVIDYPAGKNSTTSFPITTSMGSTTSFPITTSTGSSTSFSTANSTGSSMDNLISTTTIFSSRFILEAENILPLTTVLYVCIGLNIFTHALTILLGIICVRNFGKGLKERVFNSRADRVFQQCCSKN